MVERLDEERLETLRTWGAGLSTTTRDELRAAGKAILMLVDEIDRLEADLWNARAATKQAEASAEAARQAEAARPEPEIPAEPPVPVPVGPPAAERERPPAREPRERQAPAVEPSQVLAMTLSERIARGRPAPSEPAT